MRSIYKINRRIIALLLIVVMILSGCGKEKDYEIDDYAGGNGKQAEDGSGSGEGNADASGQNSEEGASTDNSSNSGQTDKSSDDSGRLADRLGGNRLKFQDDFSIAGNAANINVEYNVMEYGMDSDKLPSYKVEVIEEEDVDEEGIVKRLLGDSAMKLDGSLREETGDSDSIYMSYLTLMYDYTGSYEFPNYTTYGSSDAAPEWEMPAWTEEDDYFIHTYEGSYNNIVYQMLISYHRIGKCLTVSMFPKNVADLVDNPDIERMVCLYATGGTYIEELPDSYDMDFKTLLSDRPNLSTASDDFFKEKAYELTKKKIGIDLIDGSVVGEYNLSGYFNGTVLIEGGTTTFEVSDDENELEKTELLFLPEHIDDNLTGAVRSGYMYDVVEEFGSSGLYRSYIRYEGMTQPKMQNGGYLWVDDRGVVGFDITFGYNMKEIMSEDVPILTFENAMKAFEEAVRDNIDISKLGLADSKTKIYFKNAYFMYYPIPSPNKMGEYIFAPVWSIESVNGTITQSTTIINAMDGSLVEIFY